MSTKPRFCRNCGAQLAPDSIFCENCGQQLARDETPAPAPAPPPPPPTETPPPTPPPPPPPPSQPSGPVAQGIPVAVPPVMAPPPVKKNHSKMWALLAIGAILVIIIAGIGYCVSQNLEDDLINISGTFSKTASSGETITDNSIDFSVDPNTREVEGECVYRIEDDRSYSKTIIILIGTYTPSSSGNGGTISGTATSTYDKKIDGVDSSQDPKTSSWSASIDSDGDVTGSVGSDSFTAEVTSGSLDTSTGSNGDAAFTVSNLRISPTGTIDLGNSEDFSIYIDVENTGDAEGTYKPEATVNGDSVDQSNTLGLVLEAGEKETGYELILVETKIEILYLDDLYEGDIETTQYVIEVDGLTKTMYVE